MAIIEVYVGQTAQLVKVKCKTKDRRDTVCKAARKLARGLGGSSTPLTLRGRKAEESPVASLRLSRAVVDDMVLVAEASDGSRRVVGPDELPVELLMGSESNVRRMLLLSPAQMSQAGGMVPQQEPEKQQASRVVQGEGSEEGEDDQDSMSKSSSGVPPLAAARRTSRAALGPVPPPPTNAYPSLAPQGSLGAAQLPSGASSSGTVRRSYSVPAAPPAPPAFTPLPVDEPLVRFNPQYVGSAPKALALDGCNAWITQVPDTYAFRVEREALDLVSESQARDLQRSLQLDAMLQVPGGRGSNDSFLSLSRITRQRSVHKVPPSVNRASKPKPPAPAVKAAVPHHQKGTARKKQPGLFGNLFG